MSTLTYRDVQAAEILVLIKNASSWTHCHSSPCPGYNKDAPSLPRSHIRRPCRRRQSVVAEYKDDDDDDDEYVPRSRSSTRKRKPNAKRVSHELETSALPLKKRKRSAPINANAALRSEEDGVNQTNNTKKKQPTDQGPVPPPYVPQNVKSVIDDMGGTGLVLITQKRLTATDVKDHNNRLQIPFSQIAHQDFLTDDEKHYLAQRDENDKCNFIETPLLDPALNSHTIMLRMWLMPKKDPGAKSSQVYALTKPWMKIVMSNGLTEGDVVQVWGFRVGQQLQMALLKL